MSEHLQIAILGAGGLSGLELLTWLRRHPHANVRHVTSERYDGMPAVSYTHLTLPTIYSV